MSAYPSNLGALQHRDYRRLLIGTFCSTGGQWVQSATLGWVVYDLTQSGALLGAPMAVIVLALLGTAIAGAAWPRSSALRGLSLSKLVQQH